MIVLDTQAWLWWLHDPEHLSDAARRGMEAEADGGAMRVSVISVWEVALKTTLGKLGLPFDLDSWFERARQYPHIGIEPLTPGDAIAAARLPGGFHRDPADRFIVALARRLGVALVTSDRRIRSYRHVRTIW